MSDYLPYGFVYLSSACPTIVQNIKYATKELSENNLKDFKNI